jgi:hypothetical protein
MNDLKGKATLVGGVFVSDNRLRYSFGATRMSAT